MKEEHEEKEGRFRIVQASRVRAQDLFRFKAEPENRALVDQEWLQSSSALELKTPSGEKVERLQGNPKQSCCMLGSDSGDPTLNEHLQMFKECSTNSLQLPFLKNQTSSVQHWQTSSPGLLLSCSPGLLLSWSPGPPVQSLRLLPVWRLPAIVS